MIMEGLGHWVPGRSRKYLALPGRIRESFPERRGLEDVQGSPAKERDARPKKECFLPPSPFHKTFCRAPLWVRHGPRHRGWSGEQERKTTLPPTRLHIEKDVKQNKR